MLDILPIPYYHSVFTLPHSLNLLTLYNQQIIYDIFFKTVSQTIHDFSKDTKYLGGKGGFISLLHTWGQNLSYHVHIHVIVAGGGLSFDKSRWIGLPYGKKYLFPVKAMSCRLRKLFSESLLKRYKNNELQFPEELCCLNDERNFIQFLNKVAWEDWVCYVKEPFSGPSEVIKYVGRYTQRVAISNHRLINIENGKITFKYKIYKDGTLTSSIMSLPAKEFIRRFLLHILPDGFRKIRHYGFLSNGQRQSSLELIRELLKVTIEMLTQGEAVVLDLLEKVSKCPSCKIGHLFYSGDCAIVSLEPG